jgi:hypothetical protein
MRLRTQRNLANGLTVAVLAIGAMIAAWGILFEPQLIVENSGRDRSRNTRRSLSEQSISLKNLTSLLDKKLQGPLQPPVIKPEPPPAVAAKKKAWPKFTLDCVIKGQVSELAVFTGNNRTFTCAVGERFMNMAVKAIGKESVDVEFSGEVKTFFTSRSTKQPKGRQ